jgi:hypothetical protein
MFGDLYASVAALVALSLWCGIAGDVLKVVEN